MAEKKYVDKLVMPDGQEVYLKGGGVGGQMFDIIQKDHVLTFDESEGLAPLGSYVFKTPVAGSRYGYPDFVEQCIKEYNESTAVETTLGDNTVTIYEHSNGHKLYDIADKEYIDEVYSSIGAAWFYGIDEENERVFLPRNDWFFQSGKSNQTASGSNGAIWNFNASRSNSTYGNSDTVQPKSVAVALYMVVGNTENKTANTDVVDITTTENDTIPLFTGMYFDFAPNNPSWLKAGQKSSGSIYTSCYNTLIDCLNGDNPYNIKVIEESEMQAGFDYSTYWIINQDEMYFITPRISYLGVLNDMTTQLMDGGNVDIMILAKIMDLNSRLYFKVGNAVQNLELLDAGEVMGALATKTDESQAAHAAMPSDRYIDLTLGVSGTQYIAPADGWIAISKAATANNQYFSMYTNLNIYGITLVGTTSSRSRGFIPVKKGEIVHTSYNLGGETYYFKFIYAEGAKND